MLRGIRKISFIYVVLCLVATGAGAQELDLLRDADLLLYSGEVSWKMTYEEFQPAPPITLEQKPTGLTDEEFEVWYKKQQGIRSQTFKVRAIFQGDYLRFEITSEPGDILPMKCDRVITCNGVSITFIDNVLANMFREPLTSSFLENHFSKFYIPPRSCGYDAVQVLNLARKVKDRYEKEASELAQYEDVTNGLSIVVNGVFADSGMQKLAVLVPDETYGQVLKSIKYINPQVRDRISIDCSDFKSYADGTVYPNTTVITHHVGGTLDELEKAMLIDRMTLTVENAQFNEIQYDDELFNPGCPTGYTNLLDMRSTIKKRMSK